MKLNQCDAVHGNVRSKKKEDKATYPKWIK